jgi:DNA-binding SARP family transcriptional activator
MQSLSVRVLGDLGVDGFDLHALGSRKARTLLRLLALGRGRFVPVDALVDCLWGDQLPTSPADQLSVLMSRLRAALGRERFERGDAGYRLHYDWLDADELTDIVAELELRLGAGNAAAAAAAARAGLSLIRGEVSAATASGDWATAEIAALARLVAHARRTAALAFAASGNWHAAADLAAEALGRDPFDEEALRLLMRWNVSAGRDASALAAYAETRRRLADDLGVGPAPETEALHTAILRGELRAVTSSRPSPADDAALVGRELELRRLDTAVGAAADGNVQIVLVRGEAGIGKTTLVRAWAARRVDRGDVVLFGTCGALDRAAPLDALTVAIVDRLRQAGPERTAEVLAADPELLGPLLGLAPQVGRAPIGAGGAIGPSTLFAALVGVLRRIADRGPIVVVLDDAHQAGATLGEWLRFVLRQRLELTVVATMRAGEGEALPATEALELGTLDRASVTEIVGPARVDELYARSRGHPLFLAELARTDGAAELPPSLVASVSSRCDELGVASTTIRGAAVIGPRIDLDLLASVLHRPVMELLDDLERATARGLLAEDAGTFTFRHDLVRTALAASATASRAALLHRQAARFLNERVGADPGEVAHQARLGGDLGLAARALRAAAHRASERFDHATAESLLDDALLLHADDAGWLDRARVRTRRGHYAGAYADVGHAAGVGAAALEVGAWAAYFDRRFGAALQYAEDGEMTAEDDAVRARCLAIGGRTRHAAGDLEPAARDLEAALELARGTDRITASAWLGVLRSHQSRTDEALRLLGPATRVGVGVEQTAATLHALLFSGHAHALAGRPGAALAAFDRYTLEVERRQVPRFVGRGVNFAGWVLRNTGSASEALEHHFGALDLADGGGTPELRIAALEDLAEVALEAGDPDAARTRLDEATEAFGGDLVFGWRLRLKHRLLEARLALLSGSADQASVLADALAGDAGAMGVPRYESVARLLGHCARAQLGVPADLASVEADLDQLDASVAIEAWWWTGEVAADLGLPPLLARAEARVEQLCGELGSRAPRLRTAADARIRRWQTRVAVNGRRARP